MNINIPIMNSDQSQIEQTISGQSEALSVDMRARERVSSCAKE